MAGEPVPYVTLDVFSSERFKGNQLAIVDTSATELSHEDRQRIANEFNLSETVFLHANDADGNPRISIFTTENEMELAGHPVIGAGHYLLRHIRTDKSLAIAPTTATIMTNAGPVPVSLNPSDNVVSAEIPHNVHIHEAKATLAQILPTQKTLQEAASLDGVDRESPVVTIVKGVTYALVDLSNRPDCFDNLVPGASPTLHLDPGWAPSFTGVMYYRVLSSTAASRSEVVVWDLRVRMIAMNLEDPACGSGACSLGAYLALSRKDQAREHRFNISQGSEMGRESRILLEVKLSEDGMTVSSIKLAGEAVFVAEGRIFVR